jgi:hypothetical protein
VCASCGQQIATFFECGGLPYCEKDIQATEESLLLESTEDKMCGRCQLVVDAKGMIVTALGKQWHAKCFLCSTCDCVLETYFGKSGLPYCELHVAQQGAPPDSASSRRKKKKKASRPRRAHSNPAIVVEKKSTPASSAFSSSGNVAVCTRCCLDYTSRSAVKQVRKTKKKTVLSLFCSIHFFALQVECIQCHSEMCTNCGSFVSVSSSSEPVFACTTCLPSVQQKETSSSSSSSAPPRPSKRGSERRPPSNSSPRKTRGSVIIDPTPPSTSSTTATTSGAIVAASPQAVPVRSEYSRYPRKQEPVFFLEKAKKRIVKRWAVLQDQSLQLFKDENSARRAKEPLEVLDLKQLKRVSQLGVHQEKPFCLAVTVGYDTYVVWTEQLEYANWANAIVDSNPEGAVAIGTMEDFEK